MTTAAALMVTAVTLGTPAHAAPAMPLPAGVTVTAQKLHDPDADGRPISNIVPGDTFYYSYHLTNNTDRRMVLTGFDSGISSRVNPNRPEDVPPDHCDQFLVQIDTTDRQSFPEYIEPGATAGPFYDNATFEFLWEAGNECQAMSFNMGTPRVSPDAPDLPADGSTSGSSSLLGSLGSLTSSG